MSVCVCVRVYVCTCVYVCGHCVCRCVCAYFVADVWIFPVGSWHVCPIPQYQICRCVLKPTLYNIIKPRPYKHNANQILIVKSAEGSREDLFCSMGCSCSCFDSCLVPRQILLPHGFRMAPVFKNLFYSQCRPGKQMHKPLFASALNDDCLCGKTQATAIRHPVRGDPTHDYLRRPTC